jgi:biotin transport system substrate-specific component
MAYAEVVHTIPRTTERVSLRNSDTGSLVLIPSSDLSRADRVSRLRQRIRAEDIAAPRGGGGDDEGILVDVSTLSYRFSSYPPLGFLVGPYLWWYILLGAFLVAASAQIAFFFPCGTGMTAVAWSGSSYCVPSDRLASVTPAQCPLDICSARIPVTMQTYAVLLNGALAGPAGGALATALYVVFVCLGAPFGAAQAASPIWAKGATLSPSGGYLFGFTVASYIMGRCAAAGADRPGRPWRMLPWMLAAECAIFLCGIFWMPFGLAIKAGVPVQAICPAFDTAEGCRRCFLNLWTWGIGPFLPGELLKMVLVLLTIPLAWAGLNATKRVWGRGRGYAAPTSADEEGGEEAGTAAAPT